MPIVQNIDLMQTFQAAALGNQMRLKNEERRQKQEAARRNQLLQARVMEAQRRVFAAKTPEQRAEAEAQLGMLDSERLAQINTDQRAEAAEERRRQEHDLKLSRDRREANLDRGIAGSKMIQGTLGQAVGEGEMMAPGPGGKPIKIGGPPINLKVLFQAANSMQQAAAQGWVHEDQAAKVAHLFQRAQKAHQAQALELAGAMGQGSSEQIARGMEQMGGIDPVAERQQIASDIQEMLVGSQQMIDAFTNPETRQRFSAGVEKQAQLAGNIAAEQGAPPEEVAKITTDPEYAAKTEFWQPANQRAREMAAAEAQAKMARAKAGRSIVNVGTGTQAPTGPTHNIMQKQIIDNAETAVTLGRIRSRARKWMFTLQGRAKTAVTGKLAYLNPDWVPQNATEELRAKQTVKQDVKRMFSQFRKLITGAAASEQEIKDLEQQMPNMDMSWPEFNASMDALVEEVTTKIRLAQKALRPSEEGGGIPLTSEALDRYISDRVLAGDTGSSNADIKARIEELEKSGRSHRSIVNQMVAEGYLNEAQARAMLRGE